MAATTPSPTQTAYGAFTPNAQTELETIFVLKESGSPAQTILGQITFSGTIVNATNETQSTGTFAISSAANNLVGNGNNQGNATSILNMTSVIQTCNANNNGFILPATIAGMGLCVVNNTANVAQVFPQANQSINAGANNVAYQLSPNSVGFFECGVAAQWQALQGYQAGGTFGLLPYQNNITALGNSGNAQNYANGVSLGGVINTVLVGNANNNSVILAKSVAGMQQVVVNACGAGIVIFPFANDAINATAANTGYALANNSTAVAVAAAAGNWWTFHSQS